MTLLAPFFRSLFNPPPAALKGGSTTQDSINCLLARNFAANVARASRPRPGVFTFFLERQIAGLRTSTPPVASAPAPSESGREPPAAELTSSVELIFTHIFGWTRGVRILSPDGA
jgi:hypothetical protein